MTALRAHYEHDIADLQRRLLLFGGVVERAVAGALWALLHRRAATAERIIRDDQAIDAERYELEEQALRLIARQQPFAVDLRTISAFMGLASEIERIGDYAKGLAKIALRMVDLPPLEPPPSLAMMGSAAREMLREALAAIAQRDPAAAERLESADDRVDALYRDVLAELLDEMRAHPDQIEYATYLLWAAHNLERMADRAVNIGERVAFIVTGRRGR